MDNNTTTEDNPKNDRKDIKQINDVTDQTIINDYYLIKNSQIFNEEFYLERYPDVKDECMDPILHYLLYGADKGYNPSKGFSTNRYLEIHIDVADAKLNPLIHYLRSGIKEKRITFAVEDYVLDNFDSLQSYEEIEKNMDILNQKVFIIIPIYNAYDETRECIRSVLENTGLDYELVLINDCSTDNRIGELLDSLESLPFVRVINNSVNQGFVKNVNMALEKTEGDVVLLNSDTIVTPRWLSHLVLSAYSGDDVACVTPFSNSCDIPVNVLGDNVDQLSLNKNAYLLDKLSDYEGFNSPTGNGFCLFIKRAVIDDIGLFDEDFGMGYGEETDFTYRAFCRGWRNLRDDSVFVYHKRHASFSSEMSSKLKEVNRKIQLSKNPGVFDKWDEFVKNEKLQESINNIRKEAESDQNHERILYITEAIDGAPQIDQEFYKLAKRYEVYLLVIAANDIHLYYYDKKLLSVVKFFSIEEDWKKQEYVTLFYNILRNVKIDLVYIRYLNIFYNPPNHYLTSFMQLLSKLEVKSLYEIELSEDIVKLTEKELNPNKSLNELIEDNKNRISWKDNKTVIYTTITGNQELYEPKTVEKDFDYICFTDNPELESDVWKIRLMDESSLNESIQAKHYKILAHKYLKEYDYSLWIDSCFKIIGNIKEYINTYSTNKHILAIKNDFIECIYDDIENNTSEITENQVQSQINNYSDIDKLNSQLVSSNILFRKHNEKEIIELSEKCYEEVINKNMDDNISLNLLCSQNNIEYDVCPLCYDINRYFLKTSTYVSIMNKYSLIQNSKLFDCDYYYSNYPQIKERSLNPILHYIIYGVMENCNPSKSFSTKRYLDVYHDVAEAKINPLIHYITNGDKENRKVYAVDTDILEDFDELQTQEDVETLIQVLHNKVSIIIPISNAYGETRECIRSVLENTGLDYELVLINDCCTDKRIVELLDSLESLPFVRVINNSVNQGFVKNVNMALEKTVGDVVLLNSDTIVTPRWLSHLVLSAYSGDDVACVTPFSNSCDIPVSVLGDNVDQLSLNKNAYLLDKLSDYEGFNCPTADAFCLFIKRAVIDDIGLFDEDCDRSISEVTDFTYRAFCHGWRNLRDDSVFVYHKSHESASNEVSSKMDANSNIQLSKNPALFEKWDEFLGDEKLQESINDIKNAIALNTNPQRILYVTQTEDDEINFDENFFELSSIYDTYVLVTESSKLRLYYYDNLSLSVIKAWNIKRDWLLEDYITVYYNILRNVKIDLIYARYVKNLYHPSLEYLSSFITLTPYLEIKVIYEATLDENVLKAAKNKLNPNRTLNELIRINSAKIHWNDKKVVVYTAITGSYDQIHTPSIYDEDFDYICFTDNPDLKSEFWDIRLMEDLDLDVVRKARRYKILPHKYLDEYDYSIWIDANFDIIGDLKKYVDTYIRHDKLLAIKHDLRDCIYDEAETCIEMKKDSENIIKLQMSVYDQLNYPRHNGLIASGILFRNHHDKEVIKICEDWYNEVINYSRRDQLSFNYVCWKNNFKYDESPLFYFKNSYFQRLHHTIKKYKLFYATKQVENILESFEEKVTIIIPVYNAYEETQRCIESVLKYTNVAYDLLLINDCSSDERIKPLLDSYATRNNVRVIHNKKNLGFVENINLGFKQTTGDIVLLNSDTEVTPKWLQKLKISAYTQKNVATVTPISNNAGAFSVPEIDEENVIDEKLGLLATANIIEKINNLKQIHSPTANGFCMYIKRDAIYSAGLFDIAFGRGYGEENDFSMRLFNKKWYHNVDTSTYIYHKGNVSFLDEKDKLIMENRDYLDEKYPNYKEEINYFIRSKHYFKQRQKIKRVLSSKNPEQFNKKCILYVIHEGSGGTLHTSVELMKNVSKEFDVYVLTAGKTHLRLFKYYDANTNTLCEDSDDEFKNHLYQLSQWTIKDYSLTELYNRRFARIYFNIIQNLKVDIIHIRHLIRHTFDLPRIAKLLGIPVILSFHDFYYICPSHCLIDDKHNYCAGHCTDYEGEYDEQCMVTTGLNVPLLRIFVKKWRDEVRQMLSYCSAFVTTSSSAYELYTEFYPELKDKDFEIIEHGRDLNTPPSIEGILPELKMDEPIRILFPGHLNYNKGASLIKQIKELDVENNLEFHYMGNLRDDSELDKLGKHHGYYKRSEYCKHVHEIKPHFIGLLSIWPETYCHTLTESWSCGIPVITLDIGALGERIHKNGGGFFVENDAQKAYDKIMEISKNQEEYIKVAKQIPEITFKTTEQMADEYSDIYHKYLK